MKPKGHFTNHELKIMEQFPLIGAHQVASNMLEAIRVCRTGIEEYNQLICDILNSKPNPHLNYMETIEENKSYIDDLSGHIAFCELALYEAKTALNKLSHYLN